MTMPLFFSAVEFPKFSRSFFFCLEGEVVLDVVVVVLFLLFVCLFIHLKPTSLYPLFCVRYLIQHVRPCSRCRSCSQGPLAHCVPVAAFFCPPHAGFPAILGWPLPRSSHLELFASHICVLASLGDTSLTSVSASLKQ